MKSEDLKKAVDKVLEPFNIKRHECNPLGNLHEQLQKKAEDFGFKVELSFPIQHISYGETLRRNFNVTDANDNEKLNVTTNTYRNDQTGNYEVVSYSSKPPRKKMKP